MSDEKDFGSTGGWRRRIWRSIFPRPVIPSTDRERRRVVLDTLMLHLRPPQVPMRTVPFNHTFGLGGMSLVLIVLLFATGALMMFVYQPVPEAAYDSVLRLQHDVPFGRLVRNVHHFGANLLVGIALLHLLRVYLTGGYHGPRRFNWVIGVTLLLAILAGNFTGYLLPWDQLAYWAVTISTAMLGYVPWLGEGLQQLARGGPEITSSTLIGFFTIHTTVIPATLIMLMAWHFWRVRKAKGVVVPRAEGEVVEGKQETVLFVPHLFTREVAVACALIAVVVVVSAVFNAPLGVEANPGMSPNPAKAPWYFMGFQELLLHFHPVAAVVAIPLIALFAAVLLPYVGYRDGLDGVWMMSAVGRRSGGLAIVSAAVVTPVLVLIDELRPGSADPATGLAGLLPVAVVALIVVGLALLLRRLTSAPKEEMVQAVVLLLLASLVVLTATGVWFRGEGMALVWPWEVR